MGLVYLGRGEKKVTPQAPQRKSKLIKNLAWKLLPVFVILVLYALVVPHQLYVPWAGHIVDPYLPKHNGEERPGNSVLATEQGDQEAELRLQPSLPVSTGARVWCSTVLVFTSSWGKDHFPAGLNISFAPLNFPS